MDVKGLITLIEKNLGYPLADEKKKIIESPPGPLQIVAGPGSGKTELLTILALKSIFVEGCDPKSIIITTFTEKAAKQLRDRVVRYADFIFNVHPELKAKIDLSGLRIGTLHSLCASIMQECRYDGYENFRLMDGIEQYLFVYDHSVIAKDKSNDQKLRSVWEELPFLFSVFGKPRLNPNFIAQRYPSKADRTLAAIILFNRITEDCIDISALKSAREPFPLIADAYEHYTTESERHKRCDFSTLQKKFLQFLETSHGRQFIEGDGRMHTGISHVFVDEYQDTNPIQEKIYFKLAGKSKNLTVVGDDDQALYRFRGGTVDCIITFDLACERYWKKKLSKDRIFFLMSNYRSHEQIIRYYNTYIRSFPVMQQPRARVPGKPEVVATKKISTTYPAVSVISGNSPEIVADSFARLVQGMINHGVIKHPNQCALLMYSVRESKTWAGPFAQALRDMNIPVYNPRSKMYLEQVEIQALLGGFIRIIDPDLRSFRNIMSRGVQDNVPLWIAAFNNIARGNHDLDDYITKSLAKIREIPSGDPIPATVLEIFWRLLSFEPFATWMNEPGDRSYRLGQLTKIIDSYCSIPLPNRVGSNRGTLMMSTRNNCGGQISQIWLDNFYYSIIGLITGGGGLDDPEDKEIIVPEGQFPIMTIHQSKGLEFDFVFIYRLNNSPKDNTAVLLEDALAPFREVPPQVRFSTSARNEQDLIRLYYVAYSRAKYALIHLVPDDHRRPATGFIGNNPGRFREFVTEVT